MKIRRRTSAFFQDPDCVRIWRRVPPQFRPRRAGGETFRTLPAHQAAAVPPKDAYRSRRGGNGALAADIESGERVELTPIGYSSNHTKLLLHTWIRDGRLHPAVLDWLPLYLLRSGRIV